MMEKRGTFLKKLIKQKGLIQSEVAERAGITTVYLNKICANRAPKVSFDIMADIAEALNVSLDTLALRSRPEDLPDREKEVLSMYRNIVRLDPEAGHQSVILVLHWLEDWVTSRLAPPVHMIGGRYAKDRDKGEARERGHSTDKSDRK